ncbi:hypothetical protein F4819DRAFT_415810 [Hypoxylon fuscum]|nr:hypothetical protein F4819DRAFT_415810 [Hypoxylon fuscum]
MSASENSRGRTRPDEDDSSEDEETRTAVSQNEERYLSRVEEYANKASWPKEPLYQVGEVVYLAVSGQQQPAGPYVVVSSNFENGTYVIKRQSNDQRHPHAVPESSLRVRA